MWYFAVILLVLAISFVFAYRAAKKLEIHQAAAEPSEGVLLAIELPKENEKTPISAEQMFASLHGLLRFTPGVQEHISLEIASTPDGIRFYAYTPRHFKNFIEGQLYAQYPDAEIREVEDYTSKAPAGDNYSTSEITFAKDYIFPIKTFRDFEVDPLAAVTGALGKISVGEQVWLQILVRPVDDVWQERGHKYVEMVRNGDKPVTMSPKEIAKEISRNIFSHFVEIPHQIVTGPRPYDARKPLAPKVQLSSGQELDLKLIDNKLSKMGFEVVIRAVAFSDSKQNAAHQLSSIVASFKQFSTASLNSFAPFKEGLTDAQLLEKFRKRHFEIGELGSIILNIEELASIYHLPNISVETPSIAWTRAKKGEPPLNLPTDGCNYFAETIFRDHRIKFGIKRSDRRKHMYVIGKTGSGKSSLIKNMIIADMRAGEGVAVLDPHGDLIDTLLDFVPEERIKDVVIFNPADADYPVALNMLEVIDPRQRNLIASGLLDVFKKYFAESWGPRLEYLLMNSILTLLEVPNTSLLSIIRLLTDQDYQSYIVNMITDPVMKDFWNKEFKTMKGNQKLLSEAVSPIQNKVGQFLNASTIRNIVGQPKSTIRIDEVINNQKILFVNLATGRIGENNASLLGAMIISQLQFAAMRRVDIPEEQRKDFFVYADEFQKFATDSFANILSEARKYRLNLTMTHQYIEQMPEKVKEAIFGNVGTLVCFGVGPTDAVFLEKEFLPTFLAQDLINLGRFEMYLKLQIDDMSSQPFSARSLSPYTDRSNLKDKAIEESRQRYSRPLEKVDITIRKWVETRFRLGLPPQPPAWASSVAAPTIEAPVEGTHLAPVVVGQPPAQPNVISPNHVVDNISGEVVFPAKGNQ